MTYVECWDMERKVRRSERWIHCLLTKWCEERGWYFLWDKPSALSGLLRYDFQVFKSDAHNPISIEADGLNHFKVKDLKMEWVIPEKPEKRKLPYSERKLTGNVPECRDRDIIKTNLAMQAGRMIRISYKMLDDLVGCKDFLAKALDYEGQYKLIVDDVPTYWWLGMCNPVDMVEATTDMQRRSTSAIVLPVLSPALLQFMFAPKH